MMQQLRQAYANARALLSAMAKLGNNAALAPAGGTRMRGSAHPKRRADGHQAKRRRKIKAQRAARRISRRSA